MGAVRGEEARALEEKSWWSEVGELEEEEDEMTLAVVLRRLNLNSMWASTALKVWSARPCFAL